MLPLPPIRTGHDSSKSFSFKPCGSPRMRGAARARMTPRPVMWPTNSLYPVKRPRKEFRGRKAAVAISGSSEGEGFAGPRWQLTSRTQPYRL
jgi:hypothetical protein